MLKETKAEAEDFGPKTNDYFADNQKVFSVSDATTDLKKVEATVENILRPGRVIRLYKCFGCQEHFALLKMSSALVLCRGCWKQFQAKGRTARRNQVDRIVNTIRIFLRRRTNSI